MSLYKYDTHVYTSKTSYCGKIDGVKLVRMYNNMELYKHTLKSFWEFTWDKSILIYQAHPYRSWVNPSNPSYLDGVDLYSL